MRGGDRRLRAATRAGLGRVVHGIRRCVRDQADRSGQCDLGQCDLGQCDLGECNLGECNLGECDLGQSCSAHASPPFSMCGLFSGIDRDV
ncbi:pentapeptide repeat-containing protein [Methylorubrum aminovorans]|uniref:pentapeptide repeat-containing protein n=1 Tax=Methylorubrum aminovorans TaxID=269069 RepID=UPI003C2D7A86